jgi:hypothetical protein
MLRTALLTIAALGLLPDVARPAILEVRIEAANATTLPRWFQIEAVRVGGTGKVRESFLSGRAGSANMVTVEPGVWRVRVRVTGLGSPDQTVTIEAAGERRPLLFKMSQQGRPAAR